MAYSNSSLLRCVSFYFQKKFIHCFLVVLGMVVLVLSVAGQEKGSGGKISERVASLQKIDGYIPLYWDADGGRLLMEISRFNAEFLYQNWLATGVGTPQTLGEININLDRTQPGDGHLVFFERVGAKVLMIEPNQSHRAISENVAERRAAEESFAQSVLWGFKVEILEGKRVLVDATSFFLRDVHGVSDLLQQKKQGRYRVDESRSVIYMPKTKGFPRNTEVETLLTLTTDDEVGPFLDKTKVAPTPKALTIREHHSFIELPDSNYKPRCRDPRVGIFGIEFNDYAAPITEPLEKHWLRRFRLQKKDPRASLSEPVKPIIYYIDRGVPEPIRSALIEGTSWWNEAFEAAGFKNAFQVKILPEDVDLMDVRYNTITWVHRSLAYGGGGSRGLTIFDPRTGEIIKGHVLLESSRGRYNHLMYTGLAKLAGVNNPADHDDRQNCNIDLLPELDYLGGMDPVIDSMEVILARLRQLAAHEVGHSLGMEHNFAASSYDGRASVMDYPAPFIKIKKGKLDFSNAYTKGIGSYDKFAIQYAYTEFPLDTSEPKELERIIEEGIAHGMLYINYPNTKQVGVAHPLANHWDNGRDPVAMLRHEMEVRQIGLSQFGLANIPNGTPLSSLEDKLIPLYLHHRFQLKAAINSLGGVYYTYSVKTKNKPLPKTFREIVPAEKQWEAFEAALETITPEVLVLSPRILDLIPPRAYSSPTPVLELLNNRYADPVFDPLAAAMIAADLTISEILEEHRAARLIEFHALNQENPDFQDVVDRLIKSVLRTKSKDIYTMEIAKAVQSVMITRLMDLAANTEALPQVQAIATEALHQLVNGKYSFPGQDQKGALANYWRAKQEEIKRFLNRPETPRKQKGVVPIPN